MENPLPRHGTRKDEKALVRREEIYSRQAKKHDKAFEDLLSSIISIFDEYKLNFDNECQKCRRKIETTT